MDPSDSGANALITITLIVTLCYVVGCWIWPFTSCGRCTGTGKRRSPTGRAFRLCPRCDGTGRRLRAGRWLYNLIARTRKDGTR